MTSEKQNTPSPLDPTQGDLSPLEMSIRETLLSETIAPPSGLEARVMKSLIPSPPRFVNSRALGAAAAGIMLVFAGFWFAADMGETAPLAPSVSVPNATVTEGSPAPTDSFHQEVVVPSDGRSDFGQGVGVSSSPSTTETGANQEVGQVRLDAEGLAPLAPSMLESPDQNKTLSTQGQEVQTERRPANLEVKQ